VRDWMAAAGDALVSVFFPGGVPNLRAAADWGEPGAHLRGVPFVVCSNAENHVRSLWAAVGGICRERGGDAALPGLRD
jgi:hypothetical protein